MFSCVQTHLRLCLVLPIIASTRVVCKSEISGILPGCDGVAQGPRSECWSVAVHFLPPRGAVWGVHRDVFRVYQGSVSAYPTPVCETSRTRTRACGIPSSRWCSANGAVRSGFFCLFVLRRGPFCRGCRRRHNAAFPVSGSGECLDGWAFHDDVFNDSVFNLRYASARICLVTLTPSLGAPLLYFVFQHLLNIPRHTVQAIPNTARTKNTPPRLNIFQSTCLLDCLPNRCPYPITLS
jgi:hypothetical protein